MSLHRVALLSCCLVFLAPLSGKSQTAPQDRPEAGGETRAASPIELGGRRELFVDDFLIDRLEGASLVMHAPRDEGIVLRFDRPWEGLFSGYATVIKDGYRYRLYYRGRPEGGADGSPIEVTCYAESLDGIHWVKPKLRDTPSHRGTNIVLYDAAPATHNFSPFLDRSPKATPDARFKAIAGTITSGLLAFASADGIHWRKLFDEPVLRREDVPFRYMFDSQNVAFWSDTEDCYVCYFRVFQGGVRRIARTTSDDFRHWSKPVLMEYRHRGGDAPIEHLYTNQTHPYFRAPHIYVSVAARFVPGRRVISADEARAIGVHPRYFGDTSDAILMTTRGGNTYQRTFLSSFIRPGIGARNWVSRTNYPGYHIVPTGPNEMSIYVNQDYAQPTAHLRRYSLRLDGFASVRAPYAGGTLVTKTFTFAGDTLELNFSTSAAGSIRVELQDEGGQPVPGFTLNDCVPLIGNEIARTVAWKGGKSLGQWRGKPVRLRFSLRDADLFSLRFRPQATTTPPAARPATADRPAGGQPTGSRSDTVNP